MKLSNVIGRSRKGYQRYSCKPYWTTPHGSKNGGVSIEQLPHSFTSFFELAARNNETDLPADKLRGILAPHVKPWGRAGVHQACAYQVVAEYIEQVRPETVVVVARYHAPKTLCGFEATETYAPACTHFRMPFADLEVDHGVVARACAGFNSVMQSTDIFEEQYSMEVQLLWLSAISQALDYQLKIAPVLMGWKKVQGDLAREVKANLADGVRIGRNIATREDLNRVLLIASADLCHAQPPDITDTLDRQTVKVIQGLATHPFRDHFQKNIRGENTWQRDLRAVCSRSAIAAFMGMGRALPGSSVVELARGSNHLGRGQLPNQLAGYASLALVGGVV